MANDKSEKLPPKEPVEAVQYWLDEIKACRDRERDFRKQGQRILEIYEGHKKDNIPFNILFSNTETMMPALYSNTPRPVVQRRYKDDDPIGKAAADAGKRMLEFQLDTNIEGYETFDETMTVATLDGCLSGRGTSIVKYDADVIEEATDEEGATEPAYKEGELICADSIHWDRVYFGYARKWSKVPWVAFETFIDEEEAIRLFGKSKAGKLKYTAGEPTDSEEERPRKKEEKHQGRRKTAHLYQIWDRDGGKKVRWISPQYYEGEILVKDDPLQLTGFFPCPRPLTLIDKTGSLTPTALYTIYENQAAELNRLTVRINKIVEALKARGVYDSELGDELAKIMQADDNMLMPADKSSSLAAERGLDNAIWFMPIDKLVQVLTQLMLAREACKQVIYEITGISDILRGATKASETLGAQEIKSQWGTLRLKNKQKEVARYARDLLRMMLELAATNFSEDTWAKMTGLPFLTTAKVEELTKVAQALSAQLAGMLPQPGLPGQPPQPNPLQMQLQQVQQQLQTPQWSQVIGILRDDLQRAYRIDIETNSTVEPEAAEDKQNIIDLMTVLGQFLNGVAPLVVQGSLPFQAAQAMLLTISRRFRFGTDIEEYLKAMQAPQMPDQGKGAAQAVKHEQQMLEQQKQMAQKDVQMQHEQGTAELKLKTIDAEKRLLEKQVDLELREMQLKMDQQAMKMEQQHAQQMLATKADGEKQRISFQQKTAQLENSKFKTENVVNQKADQTITKGVSALQDIVRQLVQAVAKQSGENQAMLETLTKAITAPRVKKAVRGKDGRIESVEEQVA